MSRIKRISEQDFWGRVAKRISKVACVSFWAHDTCDHCCSMLVFDGMDRVFGADGAHRGPHAHAQIVFVPAFLDWGVAAQRIVDCCIFYFVGFRHGRWIIVFVPGWRWLARVIFWWMRKRCQQPILMYIWTRSHYVFQFVISHSHITQPMHKPAKQEILPIDLTRSCLSRG